MRNSVSSRSYNCCRCRIWGKTSKISINFFYNNADEIGQKIINCQNIVAPFHISNMADIIHRYIFLLRKKNQRFRNHFFFSFYLRCGKNWYLWGFSPNHNYNKILKSDWFSTALISALIGQFNRTVRVMPK